MVVGCQEPVADSKAGLRRDLTDTHQVFAAAVITEQFVVGEQGMEFGDIDPQTRRLDRLIVGLVQDVALILEIVAQGRAEYVAQFADLPFHRGNGTFQLMGKIIDTHRIAAVMQYAPAALRSLRRGLAAWRSTA